jgi:Protein of unknown function (DUF998)
MSRQSDLQEHTDTRQLIEGSGRVLEHRSAIIALAAAGIFGPLLFTVAFVVQGLLRLDEYSPVAETVSALEAGPGGWIQQVNFVVFGLTTIAFAVGLHLGVRPSRVGVIGPAFLGLSGVAMILNGAVFPLREDAAGLTYDPGGHFVFGLTYFLSNAAWPIMLSRRLAGDPRWRSLATYSLASGVAIALLFVANGALVIPDGAPLHPYAGVAQRAVLAVLFPCMIVLALRLLRVGRAAAPLSRTTTARMQ